MGNMYVLVKTNFRPTETYPGPKTRAILGVSDDPERLKKAIDEKEWYSPSEGNWCTDVVDDELFTIESVPRI